MNVVKTYGDKCEMSSEEVKACLKVFHDGCYLFCIDNFVILRLADFMADIEKLYYCKHDEGSSKIESGFVSHDLCQRLWNSSSTEYSDSYISILQETGLILELKEGCSTYFMPSLRAEYSKPNINFESSSLFIISSISSIPFHMQCAFAKYFLRNYENAEVEECACYNVLKMRLSIQTTVIITFDRKYLEVSALLGDLTKTNSYETFGKIKTVCAEVLNMIRKEAVPDLRYKFGVICPHSKSEGHLFAFDGSCSDGKNLICTSCTKRINKETLGEKSLWVFPPCKDYEFHTEGRIFLICFMMN